MNMGYEEKKQLIHITCKLSKDSMKKKKRDTGYARINPKYSGCILGIITLLSPTYIYRYLCIECVCPTLNEQVEAARLWPTKLNNVLPLKSLMLLVTCNRKKIINVRNIRGREENCGTQKGNKTWVMRGVATGFYSIQFVGYNIYQCICNQCENIYLVHIVYMIIVIWCTGILFCICKMREKGTGTMVDMIVWCWNR